MKPYVHLGDPMWSPIGSDLVVSAYGHLQLPIAPVSLAVTAVDIGRWARISCHGVTRLSNLQTRWRLTTRPRTVLPIARNDDIDLTINRSLQLTELYARTVTAFTSVADCFTALICVNGASQYVVLRTCVSSNETLVHSHDFYAERCNFIAEFG